jgi:hypothetical protein
VVEQLTLFLCILEVSGPSLDSETGHPNGFCGFVGFSVPPGELRDSTLNYATNVSFQILSNSSFTYQRFIRLCIVLSYLKASLNKLQTIEISGSHGGEYEVQSLLCS